MTDLALEDLLVQEGLDYKTTMGSRGAQLNIKECPFCGKSGWKVYANEESGLGNCFSCEQKFNLFGFARALLVLRGAGDTSNPAVGRYLNETRRKLGYRPKTAPAPKPTIVTTEEIELPTSAKLPYNDGWVHPYLLDRRIDGRYAEMFDLRYCVHGSWVYEDTDKTVHKQTFNNRIIIPVYDLKGKLVTFQGRDVTGASEMRYKFAGGLPGTARYLYRGHVAMQQKARRIIVSEGAFDVIGVQRAIDTDYTFHDTVPTGSWGKHLSESKEGDDQISALKALKNNGLEEAVYLYDPEPEAYEEAVKAAAITHSIGIRASVALLPKGKDPGDADARVIIDAIKSALPYTRTSGLRMKMQNPYK